MTSQITVTTNPDGTYRLPSGADFVIYSFRDSVDVQLDIYGTQEAEEMGGASMMIELDTAAGAVDLFLDEAGIADRDERRGLLILVASHFGAMGEKWDIEITYPFKRRLVGWVPLDFADVDRGYSRATGWEVWKSPDPADSWYEYIDDRTGETFLAR